MNDHLQQQLTITCAQGLSGLLAEEVRALGFQPGRITAHGVTLPASLDAIYTLNYASRLGTRVLLPLWNFTCRDREELYAAVYHLDWLAYIPQGCTFAVDVQLGKQQGGASPFRHTLFMAQVVKDAICDQYRARTGERPTVKTRDPDVQLHLKVEGTRGLLSLDTSGRPLFQRGYRKTAGTAPLQESLAAAVLQLSGFDGTQDLYDPFCGSGTLLCEAAMLATRTPAGLLREHWGFERMPDHDPLRWASIKEQLDAQRIPLPIHLMGSDLNKESIYAAAQHLTALGAAAHLAVVDCRQHTPPHAPQLIVTNPPYGERLQKISLAHLTLAECPVHLLHPDPQPLPIASLRSTALVNGGIELWLHCFAPQRERALHGSWGSSRAF